MYNQILCVCQNSSLLTKPSKQKVKTEKKNQKMTKKGKKPPLHSILGLLFLSLWASFWA